MVKEKSHHIEAQIAQVTPEWVRGKTVDHPSFDEVKDLITDNWKFSANQDSSSGPQQVTSEQALEFIQEEVNALSKDRWDSVNPIKRAINLDIRSNRQSLPVYINQDRAHLEAQSFSDGDFAGPISDLIRETEKAFRQSKGGSYLQDQPIQFRGFGTQHSPRPALGNTVVKLMEVNTLLETVRNTA